MNAFVVLATILAAASGAPQVTIQKVGYGPSQIVRAPAHDSASIESHRLGGNFAYATAEAHAYAHITPEISEATHPVAETTYTHQPAPVAHVTPAKIVRTHFDHKPVIAHQPVLAQEPVIGPVATRTHIEQPIFKKQHVTVHQPTVTQVHQPVAHVAQVAKVAAAPVAVAAPAVEAVGYAAAAPAYAAAAPAALGYAAAPAALGYAAAPALAAAAPVAAY